MPRKQDATAHAEHTKRDTDEYKRFLEAAKKAEASDDPKDFERAFKKVVRPKPKS